MTFLRKGAPQGSPFAHGEFGADLARCGEGEESTFEPASPSLGHSLKGDLVHWYLLLPTGQLGAEGGRGGRQYGACRREVGNILHQDQVVRLGQAKGNR